MKKRHTPFLVLSITLAMASCIKEEPEVTPIPEFNLDGAVAVLFNEEGSTGSSSGPKSNLFKLNAQGAIEAAIENVEIDRVETLKGGIFVVTSTGRKFYVGMNNDEIEITANGDYKGQNNNGDLIFSDGSIFNTSDGTTEQLQTTLDQPRIQSLSGNFAVVTDNSIYQIFNTIDGKRYNINGCNGPAILALSDTKAIVDDCQPQWIINMNDGTRQDSELVGWNHEGIQTYDGAVLLGQSFTETGTAYGLAHVDYEGKVTILSEYGFQPGSSSCMNCGYPNEVLYNTGDYYVVRELTKVTVIQRGNPDPEFILTGYNVTSISLDSNLVYYLAEDNTGNPITGIYNLETKQNQVLSEDMAFDQIQVLKN